MKRYRVLNPRNIPDGVPVIGYGQQSWAAGEVFEAPEGFDADGRLLREGYIEEVKRGEK